MYIVYYTGSRSNSDGIHTFRRFLDIAKQVGFYKSGDTQIDSVILSAAEVGAIVYKIESTPCGRLNFSQQVFE
jgi:hypothetical protein